MADTTTHPNDGETPESISPAVVPDPVPVLDPETVRAVARDEIQRIKNKSDALKGGREVATLAIALVGMVVGLWSFLTNRHNQEVDRDWQIAQLTVQAADALAGGEASTWLALSGPGAGLNARQIAIAERLIDEAAALGPDDPRVTVMRATLWLVKGNVQLAAKYATEAVEKSAKFPMAHTVLAAVLSEQRREDEAILSYERAISLDPEETMAQVGLAWLRMRRGDIDEAIRVLEFTISIDPMMPMARTALGYALLEHGEVERAVEQLVRADELEPNNASTIHFLAKAYERAGEKQVAHALMARAARLSPEDVVIQLDHANALADTGEVEEALSVATRMSRLAPDDARVHAVLGALLAESGTEESAISHLTRALELDPDNEIGQTALQRIKTGESNPGSGQEVSD